MLKTTKLLCALPSLLLISQTSFSQNVKYSDSWGTEGITLISESSSDLLINCSLAEFQFEEVSVDGTSMNAIRMPGVFLPNEAGAPDLPCTSRYIAIPIDATAKVTILDSRMELTHDADVAPAPLIPFDTERGPLQYQKDRGIYSKDAFYPENPVILSEPFKLRGIDVVMLAITPFQYNPVTRELIVYRDLKVGITIEGGNGVVGEDRLRSRWWDPLVRGSVLNPGAIPEVAWQSRPSALRTPDYEYLIITPDLPEFIQWADSIKYFRTSQGIRTGVVTTTQIGGNTVDAIKNYVNNAYYTWDIPPVAVLLLGDYSTGSDGIISYLYPHPNSIYPNFASDNYFADVDGNSLPDIIFARITARNAAELQVMISKFLNYERNPPADYNFYNTPVTALGWQTERWFQICSETIGGYFQQQGKSPLRINALYDGDPLTDPWSTAINTSTVLNYFGPNGLGYIPAIPQELGGFTGGTGTQIVNAINDGTFLVQHRDHGMYSGWGEPYFTTTNIASLNNVNNELPFIFSINCQTGAFHNTAECFAEKFHRKTYNGQNSGALGLIAATEVSYSFVNDTYVWGVYDNMFPDFMPLYTTQFPTSFAMPAFGNAAGKYFLFQSSWPYNTANKLVTYRLFHHHGDAFMTLYTEVPQPLTVSHYSSLPAGLSSFNITANEGASIALTLNGQILAVATGTGNLQSISIPPQNGGQTLNVTVTKQNYFRYSAAVPTIEGGAIPGFSASQTSLCAGNSVTFTDLSTGSPTSWNWSFPGGNPSSFQGQYPPLVAYSNAGAFDVILTVGNANSTNTENRTSYISVETINSDFSGAPAVIAAGQPVTFTDLSTCNPTSWQWTFTGGTPSSFDGQNPPQVLYSAPGTYDVTLTIGNGSATDTAIKTSYITVNQPMYCQSNGIATQEWIDSFTLNGQTNTSGSSDAAGYQDFTGINFPVQSGNTYNISVTPGFPGTVRTENFKIWIDFNNDGDFQDSGEEVFSAAKKKVTTNGTITIPPGLEITTRMRISMKRNAYSTPCEIFSAGEVEDYTIVIAPPPPQPPMADFSGNPISISPGQTVQFIDQSSNNPTSWNWNFFGGTVAEIDSQNPLVTYYTEGVFNVSLTVVNSAGNDTEIKTGYITVTNNPIPIYCEPVNINNQPDYISTITIGTITNATGQGSNGYYFYSAPVFNFSPGQSYSFNLSPYNSSNRNYWRIWIDLNGDGDFTDTDESLIIINNKRGTTTGTITIPAYASGNTRMRISMKTGGSQASCDDNFSGEVEDYNVTFGAEDKNRAGKTAELVMSVFPNPTSEQFNLYVGGNPEKVTIKVYSSQGNIIKVTEMKGGLEKISMTGCQPGMYFIQADDGYKQAVRKIILE